MLYPIHSNMGYWEEWEDFMIQIFLNRDSLYHAKPESYFKQIAA